MAVKHHPISNIPTGKMIRVTQTHSSIGREQSQGATLRALGLRKLNHSVVKRDDAMIRGMIFKVQHLVRVEELDEQTQQGEEGAK